MAQGLTAALCPAQRSLTDRDLQAASCQLTFTIELKLLSCLPHKRISGIKGGYSLNRGTATLLTVHKVTSGE